MKGLITEKRLNFKMQDFPSIYIARSTGARRNYQWNTKCRNHRNIFL